MRISDWSSDVCSSDLQRVAGNDREIPALVVERGGRAHRDLEDFGDQGFRNGLVEEAANRAASDDNVIETGCARHVAFTRPSGAAARAGPRFRPARSDRKSVVSGKSVSVRVDPGGGRIIKTKK